MDENENIPLENKSDTLEDMSVKEMLEYKKKLHIQIINIDKEIEYRKNKKLEAEKLFKK